MVLFTHERQINLKTQVNWEPMYLCRSFHLAVSCILGGRSRGSCPLCSYTGSYRASETERIHPYLKFLHKGKLRIWAGMLWNMFVNWYQCNQCKKKIKYLWNRKTQVSHTNAGGCREVGFVTDITVTAEGSDGVDALTIVTQVLHHMALVDVWKYRNM